jgi:UDP-2,3-diacylglucosamine pyrophosphatase LpxH
MDAVILSDLHLGSTACQADALVDFLSGIDSMGVKDVILNGDVFDSWDFRRLRKAHWKVLSLLRSLSDHQHVVWVEGNHDGPADVVSHLIGLEVVQEFLFCSGGKRILVLHGHQFDKFLTEHPIITALADFGYGVLQKVDSSFRLARLAKRNSKTFLRCAEKIEVAAIKRAGELNCQIVCCGHTHKTVERHDNISYFNSGSWVEKPCTYLEVNDGAVKVIRAV